MGGKTHVGRDLNLVLHGALDTVLAEHFVAGDADDLVGRLGARETLEDALRQQVAARRTVLISLLFPQKNNAAQWHQGL